MFRKTKFSEQSGVKRLISLIAALTMLLSMVPCVYAQNSESAGLDQVVIISVKDNRVLAVKNNTGGQDIFTLEADEATYTTDAKYQWKLTYANGDATGARGYNLQNIQDNLYMEIESNHTHPSNGSNGAQANTWGGSGGDNQKWKFVPALYNGELVYQIVNYNSNLFLQANDEYRANQQRNNHDANQLWRVVKINDGNVSLPSYSEPEQPDWDEIMTEENVVIDASVTAKGLATGSNYNGLGGSDDPADRFLGEAWTSGWNNAATMNIFRSYYMGSEVTPAVQKKINVAQLYENGTGNISYIQRNDYKTEASKIYDKYVFEFYPSGTDTNVAHVGMLDGNGKYIAAFGYMANGGANGMFDLLPNDHEMGKGSETALEPIAGTEMGIGGVLDEQTRNYKVRVYVENTADGNHTVSWYYNDKKYTDDDDAVGTWHHLYTATYPGAAAELGRLESRKDSQFGNWANFGFGEFKYYACNNKSEITEAVNIGKVRTTLGTAVTLPAEAVIEGEQANVTWEDYGSIFDEAGTYNVKGETVGTRIPVEYTVVVASSSETELVHYYDFAAGYGDTKDVTETKDYTLITPEGATSSVENGALVLDGSDKGYVQLPFDFAKDSDGNVYEEMTFSMLYKAENIGDDWARAFDFGGGDRQSDWYYTIRDGGSPNNAMFNFSGTNPKQINTGMEDGNWHQIAFSYSKDKAVLYKDGVKIGETATNEANNKAVFGTDGYNYYLGKSNWPDRYFKGLMDNVRVYKAALTDAEISEILERDRQSETVTYTELVETRLNVAPMMPVNVVIDGVKYENIDWNTDGVDVSAEGVYPAVGTATMGAVIVTVNAEVKVGGVASDSLKHYFSFDNDFSDAYDSDFVATETSEAYINDGALELKTGYIRLKDNLMNGYTEFTVSAFYNRDHYVGWERVFDFGSQTNGLYITTDNNDYGSRANLTVNGSTKTVDYGNRYDHHLMEPGRWYNVTVTFKNGTFKYYIDGALVGERTDNVSLENVFTDGGIYYIGKSHYSDPNFTGFIDDFRIYDAALVQSEIQQIVDEKPYEKKANTLTSELGWNGSDFTVNFLTGGAFINSRIYGIDVEGETADGFTAVGAQTVTADKPNLALATNASNRIYKAVPWIRIGSAAEKILGTPVYASLYSVLTDTIENAAIDEIKAMTEGAAKTEKVNEILSKGGIYIVKSDAGYALTAETDAILDLKHNAEEGTITISVSEKAKALGVKLSVSESNVEFSADAITVILPEDVKTQDSAVFMLEEVELEFVPNEVAESNVERDVELELDFTVVM